MCLWRAACIAQSQIYYLCCSWKRRFVLGALVDLIDTSFNNKNDMKRNCCCFCCFWKNLIYFKFNRVNMYMCTSHPRVNRWYLKFSPNCSRSDCIFELNFFFFLSRRIWSFVLLYLLGISVCPLTYFVQYSIPFTWTMQIVTYCIQNKKTSWFNSWLFWWIFTDKFSMRSTTTNSREN